MCLSSPNDLQERERDMDMGVVFMQSWKVGGQKQPLSKALLPETILMLMEEVYIYISMMRVMN